jgi:6-phosphogluconate dehydrogenase
MTNAKIGVIGLGVMGANLARNFASREIATVVYNRTAEVTDEFISKHGNDHLFGEHELKDFVGKLEAPRNVLIMVKAGGPVDSVIEGLLPFLEKGDVIIDGGNSNFNDTIRREKELADKGINFVGMGVSGGEEGALNGPSIMPGGSKDAWASLQPLLEAVAAKDFSGGPCVAHIGENGAGHYVKMVHNGIEYSVMQVMAEGYEMLRSIYQLPADEISKIFETFNNGKLQSFLFEISISVLAKKDEDGETNILDMILDKAGQKGTGRWTAIDAFERGVAIPSISGAVTARIMSGEKARREALGQLYSDKVSTTNQIPLEEFIPQLENALYAGMLCSYAQGYDLIQRASDEHEWNVNLSEVSRIWEGGCIIRAQILNFLHTAYEKTDSNVHLFEIEDVSSTLKESLGDFRNVIGYAMQNQVPMPSLSTGLAYFDSMTSAKVSANFIQGLRDFFGAHTYERTDKDGTFHTEWN